MVIVAKNKLMAVNVQLRRMVVFLFVIDALKAKFFANQIELRVRYRQVLARTVHDVSFRLPVGTASVCL